jgi:hypothetical protein
VVIFDIFPAPSIRQKQLMTPVRAAAEEEDAQKQKGSRRQQRQEHAESAQAHANGAARN